MGGSNTPQIFVSAGDYLMRGRFVMAYSQHLPGVSLNLTGKALDFLLPTSIRTWEWQCSILLVKKLDTEVLCSNCSPRQYAFEHQYSSWYHTKNGIGSEGWKTKCS